MLTIEELERACDRSETLELPKHSIEGPDLLLQATFFPFGFPVQVWTNHENVLTHYEEIWGRFEKQHETKPVQVHVQAIEGSAEGNSDECPPEPAYRMQSPIMTAVADRDNYAVVDLERGEARITVSYAALRYRLYIQYFLLGIPACIISTHHSTPVHAACVALDGKGILLCGDSGAGKSTLSYACARAGWTYVSDDASFLHNGGTTRLVTGDCYKVRFRPAAAQFFPELEGLEITPRAAGKPSIELQTEPMVHISRTPTATIEHIVFLNRRWQGPPQLVPYRKDVARQFMRQTLFGLPQTQARQHEVIERFLGNLDVLELRYSSLDWAIDRLHKLVREGQ